jgi:membrane-associated phospholipid phosphatase
MRVARLRIAILCLLGLVGPGCAGGGVPLPSLAAIGEAAADAARDPSTWVPLVAAVVIGLGKEDDEISAWAVEEAAVFGSPVGAQLASDALQTSLVATMLTTSLLAPASDGYDELAGRTGANLLAWGTANALVEATKLGTGRERPNGSDLKSFPSGHAATAFVSASLIEHNLRDIPMPRPVRGAVTTGLYGLALGTAWARVEAHKHYPSDILVGAAFGNFFTRLYFSTLVERSAPARPTVSVDTAEDRTMLRLHFPLF